MSNYSCERSFLRGEIYTISYLPQTEYSTHVLFCMPLDDERRHTAHVVNQTMRKLAESGIGATMYDYPGTGESAGDTCNCTMENCRQAGSEVVEKICEGDGTEVVFLGVRSGCFVAADLASKAGGRSVLWQPFVSGNRFLRELKLKEQIRSGLTGKRDGSSILLNGEKMPDELRNELSEREALFSASGNTLIIQISSTQKIIPQYKKLESEAEVKQVSIPPFWNPHEHWDCSAIIDMTVKLITGEENG